MVQQHVFKILNNIDAEKDLPGFSMTSFPAFLRSIIPDLHDAYIDLWEMQKKTTKPGRIKIQAAMAELGYQKLSMHNDLARYKERLDNLRHSTIGDTESFQVFEGQNTAYHFMYANNKATSFRMMEGTSNRLKELAGSIYTIPYSIVGIALTLGAKEMIEEAKDMGSKKFRGSVEVKIDKEIENFTNFIKKRELHLIVEFANIDVHDYSESDGYGDIQYYLPILNGGIA